ncbi:MAG: prolipoprotein diacylglyceryl transferase [Clostridia bacterium]|nr:prolipoprotein diacylglyceryl transferase [Clostridia bacterium]
MLRISSVSFPGLGIGEAELDSVAFSIGSFDIAWYALIIIVGMISAVAYIMFRASKIGITPEDILDAVLFVIPIGILGARLYYVLMNIENYSSFADALDIRSGGLAIYGGIIAGTLTVLVVCKIKNIRFMAFADCVSPGLILAQAIGRWGNFMNGEAFGGETDIFCRMGLNNFLTAYDTVYVHPTFLYESLWNVLGFILINLFYKHKKYDGQIFLLVFGWYGFGRMLIEGLRQDSLYIGIFRVSQVLGGCIFIVCAALLVYFIFKKPYEDLFKYDSKYKKKGKK